ncbi:LLM class F420-dependent oxidoreductase [Chloroflexi bacterium TSY]|nr:LLM class F420-dependent oxidoreductase [Chloroflexi bacterium TSY]
MKYGLFSMNTGCCSYGDAAVTVAQAAEDAGFDSLWVSEHFVLPDPPIERFQVDPFSRRLDPLIMLTYLAAHTNQVKLGTGVVILPQRNPVILAKELASLDELSKGRLIFGFGVGHLQPELEAIGVPFNERGARTDEYLIAMKSLWYDEKPAYSGRFVEFANVQSHPQRHINLVVGGYAPAALRRTVRHAHGWYGFSKDLLATEQILADLKMVATEVQRPVELGELEISISPPRGLVDEETVEAYAELGVDRLILVPPTDELAERLAFVETIGQRYSG